MRAGFKSGNVRALLEFLGALLLLATALMLALASKDAVNRGDGTLAITFSLMALFMALLITVTLVPRLARRIDVGRWKIPFTFSITGLGGFYILGVFLVSLAAINTGNNLLFMVLAALLSAVIVSGISARAALRSISLSLQVPENVFEGESVGIKVTLQNQKRIFPAFSISVEDLALGKGRTMAARLRKLKWWRHAGRAKANGTDRSVLRHPAYFPMIQPGESRSELVSQTFQKRGRYNLEGFRISTRFPFGLFRRGEKVKAYGEVLVYPSVREVSSYFHLLPFLPGILESRRVGQGESLYSIRHYEDGESARWVDWKATAKTGELMAREFAQEEESNFCLVLDTHIPPPLLPDHSDVFERAVSLAASLAAHFCYRGAELEFISAREYVPRGMGPDQLYRILRSLAVVDSRQSSRVKGDLRQELQGVTEPMVLEQLLSAKTFKIIITSKARGSLPAPIWQSSHVIYFDEL